MERRFEAYKTHVVRPFFRDHFQRIDRQIVLVDVLAAVDAGPVALAELEEALDQVLLAFRTGRNTLLSRLFSPRADRVLFAATKADHIHHTEPRPARRAAAPSRQPRHAPDRSRGRAGRHRGARLGARDPRDDACARAARRFSAVAGTPEAGERVGGEIFDGETEAAVFPGELPERPEAVLEGAVAAGLAAVPALPAAASSRSMRRPPRPPAAYPPRPGARVPDRGPPRMTPLSPAPSGSTTRTS